MDEDPINDEQDALMRPKITLPQVGISSGDPKQENKSLFCQRKLLNICEADLKDPDLAYEMTDGPKRGICLIFNHHEFDKKTGQSRRDGTNKDAECMQKLFAGLKYDVKVFTDATTSQYLDAINQVRSMDHSSYDSFVCIILSHGDNGHIYTYDQNLPLDWIVSQFRGDVCPFLVGKPKLFFIQACRGSTFDGGAHKMESDDAGDRLSYKLPVEADILVSNSTFPGYFAWRNSREGSWYIQELYQTLMDDLVSPVRHDIITLLAKVARKVAVLYESNTGQMQSHGKKQMTNYTSTLTKLCYLTGKPTAK
ncbi:Caspase-3 [Cichlidogyrus casuarinus]|uniref:Caspase-3 n=1 Tax=Cichlidogyrus casuarinus TaxID=1844966 RepID=A0ABD2QNQ5_9PLAT